MMPPPLIKDEESVLCNEECEQCDKNQEDCIDKKARKLLDTLPPYYISSL